MKACFFIGLGGTGYEIIDAYLKIRNDYKDKDEDIYEEYFCLDVASYKEITKNQNWKKVVDLDVPENNVERYHQLAGFQNGREFINKYKNRFKNHTNIEDIFPSPDPVVDDVQNVEGCWLRRKTGFLSLFSHLEVNTEIFDNIEQKITYFANRLQENDQLTVFFFIINSLSGGTGSGLCLPFTALLKEKLNSTFQNLKIVFRYVGIVTLPEILEKGGRKDTVEKRKRYAANTYIALNEIDYLNNQKREYDWNVQFNDNNQFKLDSGKQLFDGVLLLSDLNSASKSLAVDDYHPYFQMVSWFLFALARQSESFLASFGQNLGGFGSIGLSVAEIPKADLLRFQLEKILGLVGNRYKGQRLENSAKVQDAAKDFGISNRTNGFKNSLMKKEKKYVFEVANRLKQYKTKKDIERIKKEPFVVEDFKKDIAEFELDVLKNFDKFLLERINLNWSLIDLAGFIAKIKDLNAKDKEKNEKRLSQAVFDFNRTRGDLDGSKKARSALSTKKDLESLNFQKIVLEKVIGLQRKLDEHFELRRDFFKSLNKIFTQHFPHYWTAQFGSIETRFKHPPSDLIWDFDNFKDLEDLSKTKELELFNLEKEEEFISFFEKIMSKFSQITKDPIKAFFRRVFHENTSVSFNEIQLESMKNFMIDKFTEVVWEYLENELFSGEEMTISNYPLSFSDDIVKKSYPFIRSKYKIKDRIRNYIFANANICRNLPQKFADFSKQYFGLPNNIIIYFSIVERLTLEDLEPHLKKYKAAFDYLKDDNKHCFLDDRIDILKHIIDIP